MPPTVCGRRGRRSPPPSARSRTGCFSPPAAQRPTTGPSFPAAERLGKRGRHIITTAVEHHAVLHPMQKLEAKGFEVTYLQPDHDGNITVEELKKALRPDTILVSVMMVNNETGAVMPIADMVKRHAPRRAAGAVPYRRGAGLSEGPVPGKGARSGHDLRLRAQNSRRKGHGRAIYPSRPSPPRLLKRRRTGEQLPLRHGKHARHLRLRRSLC